MFLRAQDGWQSLHQSRKERYSRCSHHAPQGLAFVYSNTDSSDLRMRRTEVKT